VLGEEFLASVGGFLMHQLVAGRAGDLHAERAERGERSGHRTSKVAVRPYKNA
jgi:hypothetical protein